jgi:NTE family protein
MERPRRAFVLTGGGALGAVQVGALQALFAGGITADLLVGTSAGALNAAFIAHDPCYEAAVALEAIWRAASRNTIFPIRPREVALGLAGRLDHLVSPAGIRRWIEANLSFQRFDEVAVPLYVVATDLSTGEPVVLSEGEVLPALLASTALPGIFPPVRINGATLVDGGISADVPVLQAEELGATEIWVLSTSGSERPGQLPRSALEVLLRSVGLVLGHVSADHLAQLDPATAIHVLPAPAVADSSILDFRHTSELIAQGRALTERYLAEHITTAEGWTPT